MPQPKALMKRTLKRLWIVIKLIYSIILLIFLLLLALSLIDDILDGRGILIPLLLLWIVTAYLILPRIHRFLTRIYLPDYFIGRTKTSDGFYADPVNIALKGPGGDLHAAMKAAGWHRAQDITLFTAAKMLFATLVKRSYPAAPVSPLFLFSRRQDFAYQQEINRNPRVRHHVRFWRVPQGWRLPGGHSADWVAAATYDKHVGFSLYTGQFTHKVTDDTDVERDYVVESLKRTSYVSKVRTIKHFYAAFRGRNGGGDRISTDGALPFVTLVPEQPTNSVESETVELS